MHALFEVGNKNKSKHSISRNSFCQLKSNGFAYALNFIYIFYCCNLHANLCFAQHAESCTCDERVR